MRNKLSCQLSLEDLVHWYKDYSTAILHAGSSSFKVHGVAIALSLMFVALGGLQEMLSAPVFDLGGGGGGNLKKKSN